VPGTIKTFPGKDRSFQPVASAVLADCPSRLLNLLLLYVPYMPSRIFAPPLGRVSILIPIVCNTPEALAVIATPKRSALSLDIVVVVPPTVSVIEPVWLLLANARLELGIAGTIIETRRMLNHSRSPLT
jgi:hypothetical protein